MGVKRHRDISCTSKELWKRIKHSCHQHARKWKLSSQISKDSWRNSYFQIKGKAFGKRLHLSWHSNEKPDLDILRQRGKRWHSGGGKTEVWKDMEAEKRKSDPGVVNSLVWWTQKEFLGWSESESWIHLFGSDHGEPWTLAWELSSSSSEEPLNLWAE